LRLNPYRSFAGATIVASALALFPPAVALAQQTSNAQPDIYANFVGVWVGTDTYLENGREVTEPERVIVVESKKKDSMNWKYEDGTKGRKGYDRYSRQITLSPADSEITLVWENSVSEKLKAADLDTFAKTGLGTFSAVKTKEDDGKTSIWILKFDPAAERAQIWLVSKC